MTRIVRIVWLLPLLIAAACSSGGASPTPVPIARATNAVAPPAALTATATAVARDTVTAAPTATLAAAATRAATPSSAPAVTATAAPPATPNPTVARTTSTPAPTAAPTAAPTQAAFDPSRVRLELQQLPGKFTAPLLLTGASDGTNRIFVVEKAGTIRLHDGQAVVQQPFLDIRNRVGSSSSEQGLLGLAFPPNFRETGFFFVDYTDRNGDTVVSRFHVDPGTNRADAGSEFRVLFVDQPAANHNGGNLVFGPDGMLWIGMGDGGGAGDRFGNGQNPNSLLGKILRIDVTSDTSKPYTVPGDNPWVTQQWNGRKMVPEAWSLGMRNPWRFSFDPQTKALWIADVGQNAYEEIDRIDSGPQGYPQGGLNFGWPMMEGTHCYPATAQCRSDGLVVPVFDYARTSPRCSITGGYVYRGSQFPALNGVYLFSDYCSGEIWALAPGAGGRYQSSLLLDSPYFVSSFGRDDAGELYVTDLSGGGVYRVVVR